MGKCTPNKLIDSGLSFDLWSSRSFWGENRKFLEKIISATKRTTSRAHDMPRDCSLAIMRNRFVALQNSFSTESICTPRGMCLRIYFDRKKKKESDHEWAKSSVLETKEEQVCGRLGTKGEMYIIVGKNHLSSHDVTNIIQHK